MPPGAPGRYMIAKLDAQDVGAIAGPRQGTAAWSTYISVDDADAAAQRLVSAEAPADWATLRSPENYTGYERTENFASPGGAVSGTPHAYTAPVELRLNQWALAGDWTMDAQALTLNQHGGRITCRFHARDLHLVMGPAARGASVPFHVLVDGQPPDAANGADADGYGYGTVTEQRLYQLIRQAGPITARTFEISFPEPGIQVYAFTFG